MKPMLDLNLLFVAESLYRTLNVSKTAKELNMSQSATSHALNRLRLHFHDPLFVRVSKGMAATEQAKRLQSSIEELTRQAYELSQRQEKFDPLKAKGRVTIATSDMIEVAIVPALLKRLQKEAPGVQLSIRSTGGEFPKGDLENGTYDLAIAGFYDKLPEGFLQSKLIETGFSIAYRTGHPLGPKKPTAAQYFDCEHALITLQGDFKDNLQQVIQGKKRTRRIVFGSYSFTGIAWTLVNSDLVLTAPTILLKRYQEHFALHVQSPPITIPNIELRMAWHSLTHKDPLKKWFREVIKEEFQALKG